MKIKLPAQITKILNKLAVLGRHHYFVSAVILLLALSGAVYVVNETLSATNDQAYRDERLREALKASFDKDTIQKIQNLQKSSEHSAVPPEIPAGTRTNPFAE